MLVIGKHIHLYSFASCFFVFSYKKILESWEKTDWICQCKKLISHVQIVVGGCIIKFIFKHVHGVAKVSFEDIFVFTPKFSYEIHLGLILLMHGVQVLRTYKVTSIAIRSYSMGTS